MEIETMKSKLYDHFMKVANITAGKVRSVDSDIDTIYVILKNGTKFCLNVCEEEEVHTDSELDVYQDINGLNISL